LLQKILILGSAATLPQIAKFSKFQGNGSVIFLSSENSIKKILRKILRKILKRILRGILKNSGKNGLQGSLLRDFRDLLNSRGRVYFEVFLLPYIYIAVASTIKT